MANLDPALLAKLLQYGSATQDGRTYSSIGIGNTSDAGSTYTPQGFATGTPGNGELYNFQGMGAPYPKSGLNPTDLEQGAAFLAAFALGGQALGAMAGGAGGIFGAGADSSLAVQGNSINALDASTGVGYGGGAAGGAAPTAAGYAGDATAAGYDPAYGAYSGAPDTSVMGASGGASPYVGSSGGMSGLASSNAAFNSAVNGGGGLASIVNGGGSGGFLLSSLLGGGGSSALGGYGSLIGPATSLIGAALGANAAKSAAGAQVQASNNALGLQRDVYNTQLGLQAPYRDAGAGALTKLSSLLGTGGDSSAPGYGSLTHNFGLSDFQMDPGIQFQTQQGNLALQNSQAARDGVLSGSALKDLIGFNQGMAGTGYQNAYDRYMNNNAATYSRLMGVTGIGQAAASNSAANAGAFGQNAGNTMIGIGNAQAGGAVGSANAITGGLTNIGSMYYLQNLLNQQKSTAAPSSIG